MDASEAAKLQQQLADITKKANDKEEKRCQAEAKLEDALRTPNPPPPPTATKTPKIAQPDKFNGERGVVAEMFARQTGSVADYTHTFVQHASAAGWEIPTLLSQYRQGLKRDIQMALIVSRTAFTTINEVATLALELDTAMSGAEAGTAPAKQKINPDAMDLSVLNGRLSGSEKARMMR
ncbi:hypothetical protein PtB15_15B147 [Puccinia triticina]|nr:hypothetical protein PtB15_15B147 [Puccinia triticina]